VSQQRSGKRGATIRTWLAVARRRSIVVRALKFAVVVGTVIAAINHGDAILAGDVDARRVFKMLITALVPYTVSTLSSVAATLERDDPRRSPSARYAGEDEARR
jgi:hypothetical protein